MSEKDWFGFVIWGYPAPSALTTADKCQQPMIRIMPYATASSPAACLLTLSRSLYPKQNAGADALLGHFHSASELF